MRSCKGRPIYTDAGVLCRCSQCGCLHAVEPHGVTAPCECCRQRTGSRDWTVHLSIPTEWRDASGCVLLVNPEHHINPEHHDYKG